MKKKFIIGALVLASSLTLTACGQKVKTAKPSQSQLKAETAKISPKLDIAGASLIMSDNQQAKAGYEFIGLQVNVDNPKKSVVDSISSKDFVLNDDKNETIKATDLTSKDGKSYQSLTTEKLKEESQSTVYLTFQVKADGNYKLTYSPAEKASTPDNNELASSTMPIDMKAVAASVPSMATQATDFVNNIFLGDKPADPQAVTFMKDATSYYENLKLINGASDLKMTDAQAQATAKAVMAANKAQGKTEAKVKVLYPTYSVIELTPTTLHFTDISFDATEQNWVNGQPDSSFDPDGAGNLVLKSDKQNDLNQYVLNQIPSLVSKLKPKSSNTGLLSLAKDAKGNWSVPAEIASSKAYKSLETTYYYGQ